jgi:flagellin-specific chaperone FliS
MNLQEACAIVEKWSQTSREEKEKRIAENLDRIRRIANGGMNEKELDHREAELHRKEKKARDLRDAYAERARMYQREAKALREQLRRR